MFDRINHAPEALTIVIDSVVAGRDVNLVLEDSFHQVGGNVGGTIEVFVNHIPNRNTYSQHFTIPKTEVGTDHAVTAPPTCSSSGATGVDSHYIFELHNAIQDRGPLRVAALPEERERHAADVHVDRRLRREREPGRRLRPRDPGLRRRPAHLDRRRRRSQHLGGLCRRQRVGDDDHGHRLHRPRRSAGTGWINVNVDGDVWVKEVAGDMRIGLDPVAPRQTSS